MKSIRPRLSSGPTVDLAPGNGPDLAERAPDLQLAPDREPVLRRGLRTMAQIAVLTLVLTIAIGAVLSATVMVGLSAGDGSRFALVLRGAYSIGSIPQGATVYVSSQPAAQDAIGHLGEAAAGVPGGSVVTIVAGPNAVITTKAGVVHADGKSTGTRVKVNNIALDRQYVALCVSGSGCTPGEAVIVPQQNVIGAVKGYLSTTGYRTVTPVPAR